MKTLSGIAPIPTISPVILLSLLSILLLSGCKGKVGGTDDAARRSEPVLTHDTPVYDETTGTFSLDLKADSVSGADLVYSLIDGDSVVMKNDNGRFSGIAPLEDGYDVKLEVRWNDTVIERRFHILDFVVPRMPVDKISPGELERLINSTDKSERESLRQYLAQSVVFNVHGGKLQPKILSDAITLIAAGQWQAVEVEQLQYNDQNLITEITVRPVGEQSDDIDTDDEDYDY